MMGLSRKRWALAVILALPFTLSTATYGSGFNPLAFPLWVGIWAVIIRIGSGAWGRLRRVGPTGGEG